MSPHMSFHIFQIHNILKVFLFFLSHLASNLFFFDKRDHLEEIINEQYSCTAVTRFIKHRISMQIQTFLQKPHYMRKD